MADIEEIIEYMKSLKKGFDKSLFQTKVDVLSHQVDTVGLEYDDFHVLFKVWLNLSIPITKWTSVGMCLVPKAIIQEHTVDYAYKWILANWSNQTSFPMIAFLLDWLTAAMDCKAIDMKALDNGYEIFYGLFTCEFLTTHAVKLVYMLTKPFDVTRRRVLQLIDYEEKIERKKSIYRQYQIVLGLFKSYRPECVPERIPAISINTSFKKVYNKLVDRFKKNEDCRNRSTKYKQDILWVNPLYKGSNKKNQLFPDMEFCQLGSPKYTDDEQQKNYFDFTEAALLVRFAAARRGRRGCRPARLRALLAATPGLALLALAADEDHHFLSHDLRCTLDHCFLEGSRHSVDEKQALLQRLAELQRTMLQGIPVLTVFLAQYLPFSNDKDFFYEMLQLAEWVDVESPDYVLCIVQHLVKVFHRAQPIEQCAILTTLTNLYTNMVYASTRERQYFMSTNPSRVNYMYVLPKISELINDMCNKGLQVNPYDMRLALWSTVWSKRAATCWASLAARNTSSLAARIGSSVDATGSSSVVGLPPAPPRLCAAAALMLPSALLMENFADVLVTCQKILQSTNKNSKDQAYVEIQNLMKKYTFDIVGCLHGEDVASLCHSGVVFSGIPEELVKQVTRGGGADAFTSKNHLAFARYTHVHLEAIDVPDAFVDALISQKFTKLRKFLKVAVS